MPSESKLPCLSLGVILALPARDRSACTVNHKGSAAADGRSVAASRRSIAIARPNMSIATVANASLSKAGCNTGGAAALWRVTTTDIAPSDRVANTGIRAGAMPGSGKPLYQYWRKS
jgi:hypothetical protein